MDINVLLDVFQKREPHYASSAHVIGRITAGTLEGICPAHGLTTLYYLVRKHSSKSDAESALRQILSHFQIGNLNAAEWQNAQKLPIADFEDAAVTAVAMATASVFIITRNVADFARSPVPAVTPTDFLSQFSPDWRLRS